VIPPSAKRGHTIAHMLRRLLAFALGLAVLLGVSVAGGGFFVQRQLQNSLPLLSGTIPLSGLEAGVTVDRDEYGIPTITAGSRADAARALGFVHAQDRFFQMDLQRRQAAGELSALVGERAVAADRAARVHRFRHISRQAVAQTQAEYRRVLEAYADGVNAGLASLGAEPIEYHVLRTSPEPWKIEDTILTVLAMFNTLQGRQPQFEATFGTMRETLPPAVYGFLTAHGSDWDAPVTGGRFVRPPIPDAATLDVRATSHAAPRIARSPDTRPVEAARHPAIGGWSELTAEESAGLGSNNWAVAGTQTASGVALVANDMHLGINVPNIWYRASIVVPDLETSGQTRRMTGVTLPGLPSLVVGSNGHVAWGFTNTGGDWSDLVIVENDARAPGQYRSPGGAKPFEIFNESIAVAGSAPVPLAVRWTEWGPVIRQDHQGRDLVQRWVAHDAMILAGDITAPERARTVEDALIGAAGLGIPGQNFVAGDASGRIGWTIAGPIPRRVGFDGSHPTSWADGTRRWDGYLRADEFPRVIDPAGGRLWTANSAVVEGDMLAAIGEGGYADGIRARIIRDRLAGIDKATAADMLSVQLDNSALFLDRWRVLLTRVLSHDVTGDPRRTEFKRLVETTWTGRADPESVAYRLVRAFRSAVSNLVYGAINDLVRQQDPDFDFGRANRAEGPLWQIVSEQPRHYLPKPHESWQALFISAVDQAIVELTANGSPLADQTWGAYNRAVVTHPLGSAIPLIGRWVNMPDDPLPGDIYTPRAHSPRAGPSQRMVVSPGREHEGIMHMPTGQSGHPLSPHYRDQHRAWVEGTPLPFLPGATVTRLTLVPSS
jgi:penicillin amidase